MCCNVFKTQLHLGGAKYLQMAKQCFCPGWKQVRLKLFDADQSIPWSVNVSGTSCGYKSTSDLGHSSCIPTYKRQPVSLPGLGEGCLWGMRCNAVLLTIDPHMCNKSCSVMHWVRSCSVQQSWLVLLQNGCWQMGMRLPARGCCKASRN